VAIAMFDCLMTLDWRMRGLQADSLLMRQADRSRYVLITILTVVAGAQSLLGLAFPAAYRDVAWIRATWFGNDLVTLVLAFPLLVVSLYLDRRQSVRGQLLLPGMLAYFVYNEAYYLLGAQLNIFFPLYAGAFLLSSVALLLTLTSIPVADIATRFGRGTPARMIGGYMAAMAFGLTGIWLTMWGAYIFAGHPTPVEPDAFRLIAALDLSLMVPALSTGGILLWRRRPWGYVIGSVAGVQASLYLIVLAVNACVAVQRGLVASPGELPIWGVLALLTTIATLVLFHHSDKGAASDQRAS